MDLIASACHAAPLVCVVLIVAGLIAGCSDFVPPEVHDDPLDRITRQGVLSALEASYNSRDIHLFLSCMADSVEFYLEPSTAAANPSLPDSWGIRCETVIHEETFGRRASVESITLELTQEREPLEIEGPTPDSPSMWEHYERYAIAASIGGVTHEVHGYATFTLATHDDDIDMHGNRLWSIVRWTDTGDVPCRRRDVTNWTELKLRINESNSLYPARTSVANVIQKLDWAYTYRDALAVIDCFADSFRFWLNEDDIANDPSLPRNWRLDTEARVMWNMLGPGTDIQSVYVRFWSIDSAAPPAGGDRSEPYFYAYSVDFRLPDDLVLSADAACMFLLAADPDETGPSGETLWEITRWDDIDYPASDAGPRGQARTTSWGVIKSMYR